MTVEEGLDSPAVSGGRHGHQEVHQHYHLMDWLEDSISYLPDFLSEPYSVPEDIAHCEWWIQDQNQSLSAAAAPPITVSSAKPKPRPAPKPEFPQKRKLDANPAAVQRRRTDEEFEEERKPQASGGKKGHGRESLVINSGCCGGGSGAASRESRWAEQLLNPLATAIEAANLSRAQHLIYVLKELASATGDANQRLAFYGLRVLARHISPGSAAASPSTFASTESRLFCSSLIKFHEVSAWFAFPNCLANEAILQVAMAGRAGAGISLHVVDAGVSHGLQWPTLMEALTRRGGVGPGLVRLTVVGAGTDGPFGSAPAGYDFVPQLLRYAKSIELNLWVEREELGQGIRRGSGKEVVVVCAQFRAGRAAAGFWQAVKEIEPDLLVLSEMDECRGAGFGRKAEYLWSFLESTSVGFKGKDCEERRVVEGEAARLLEDDGSEGWGRDRWTEKMKAEGFKEEGFGEEAVEAGRGLLKKYEGNWEMKVDGAVGLWWKGQPVSFCSLWKPAGKTAAGVFAAAAGCGGRIR
ncbi:Nodulation-signaling pathway 1 protein [Platanthera guangdongensis]|uniref:Nodulation-signaling pathway 1 protein n=1 Tax=Platanthera guangdongensis TaxID=2320717 RepID=A0ABR2LJT7_9ASPA